MKAHWFHILLSVSPSPRHGAGIQQDVLEFSGGTVRLWPATLYGALEELSELGWIEEVTGAERPRTVSGRERFYRLTHPGEWSWTEK